MIYTISQSKINTQRVNEYSKNLTSFVSYAKQSKVDQVEWWSKFSLRLKTKGNKTKAPCFISNLTSSLRLQAAVWGILLFSREDLAFINLRSLLSSLLKALHVCLFATLNNKRIVFVGDPQPLVQEHQQRLLSCFVSNQVKSFTTKLTELLPPLLPKKERAVAKQLAAAGSLTDEVRLPMKQGLVFPLASAKRSDVENQRLLELDKKPLKKKTSSNKPQQNRSLTDDQVERRCKFSLRLKTKGNKAKVAEKERVIAKKLSAAPLLSSLQVLLDKANRKKQENDVLNLNTTAFVSPTIVYDSSKHRINDVKAYDAFNFCPLFASGLWQSKTAKNPQLKNKGSSFAITEFKEKFSLKKDLRTKLTLNKVDLEQKLGLSTIQGDPILLDKTNGRISTINQPAKVEKATENKQGLDEPPEKAQTYFFYTGMAKLASKAAIRSSQWTATLAQSTNLWIGGFFSNNMATYKQSLSSATLLNLRMDSQNPFLAEAQRLAQQGLLPCEASGNLSSRLLAASRWQNLASPATSLLSAANKQGQKLTDIPKSETPRQWKQTNSKQLNKRPPGKEPKIENRLFFESSLLSSSGNSKLILESVDVPSGGLWNAIYTPVPRKNLGNNLVEKPLNNFQRKRLLNGFRGKLSSFRSRLQIFRNTTAKGSVLKKPSSLQWKKPYFINNPTSSVRLRAAETRSKKLRLKTFGIKSKKMFHEKAISHCLNSIETNKTTNAWLKEADLVFFANPEKSLSLLNQINRLKIPTLGIINSGSNLAFPFRSVKGPSLLATKPTVNYPIIGNSNSLNFLRLVLTKFTCILGKKRS